MAILLGATATMAGVSDNQAFTDLMNGGGSNSFGGTGQLASRRTFVPGSLPTWTSGPWSTDITTHNVERSWISFKGTLSDMWNGNLDAQMSAFITSIPAGHPVIWTFRHEPENDGGIVAADWRRAQRYFHNYTHDNKGTKDLQMAPIVMGYTFWDASQRDPADWIPIYQTGDDIPSGFAVGDPAWDIYGIDFYDENTSSWWDVAWDPIAGGNPKGLTGMLDDIVTVVGGSFSRADLVWALPEVSTKRSGTEGVNWWTDLINGALADDSQPVQFDWFHSDNVGADAPFDMPESIQDWIRANGNTHGTTTTFAGKSLMARYDVASNDEVAGKSLDVIYDVEVTETPVETPNPAVWAVGGKILGMRPIAGTTLPDVPTVTLTSPVVPVLTGGPELTVQWQWDQEQGLAQQQYRLQVVQLGPPDTILYDTGWKLGADSSFVIDWDEQELPPNDTVDLALNIGARGPITIGGGDVARYEAWSGNTAITVLWGSPHLTITSPTDQAIWTDSDSVLIEWTFTDDKGGTTQSAYRLRLLSESGLVLEDTGWVDGAITSVDLPYNFSNQAVVRVEAQLKNNHGIRSD